MALTVGNASTELDPAAAFITRYTGTPTEHWSYPAYDAYPGGPGNEISEQDLLAPILLNVPRIQLKTFDALRANLAAINERLRVPELNVSLVDADTKTIGALVNLIALLDDPGFPGVKLTVFTKILHRKRPTTIPLYDKHIWRCYADMGTPTNPAKVTKDKDRTWADFARAWLPQVQADLQSQHDHWIALANLAPNPTITPLRALDMIGWALGDPQRRYLN